MDLFEIAKSPITYIKETAKGRSLGVTNSPLFPLELFDAMGLYPVWMPPVVKTAYSTADKWIQVFMCARSKSFVDLVGSEGLDVRAVGVPTDCDAKDVIPGILQTAGFQGKVLQLKHPIRVDHPDAVPYLFESLKEVVQKAGEAGLEVDPKRLKEACLLRARARSVLRGYFEGLGETVDPLFAYAAAVSYQVMPVEEFLEALPQTPPAPSQEGVPVMISASEVPSFSMIEELAALGARIVGDDSETGSRGASIDTNPCEGEGVEELLQTLAIALVGKRHGPTKVGHINDRIRWIVSEGLKRRVRAVVFLLFKFCDPHAFEVPDIARALEGAGIRHLVVEVEKETHLIAREKTRLQTLFEAVEG